MVLARRALLGRRRLDLGGDRPARSGLEAPLDRRSRLPAAHRVAFLPPGRSAPAAAAAFALQGSQQKRFRALSTVELHPEIPPDIARQVRLAARLDEAPLSSAISLSHYRSGAEGAAAIERDIAAARHHVHLEFYIWSNDGTGQRLRDLLIQRAQGRHRSAGARRQRRRRGERGFLRDLIAAGGQYARFNPPRFGLRLRLLNFPLPAARSSSSTAKSAISAA